ncbi:MAG TPA: DUF2795 domain-containing protein [Acidimicrobiales bacterium]|nr:DUF2795 domain-containing protein [Acidimicrobiales bacterium]
MPTEKHGTRQDDHLESEARSLTEGAPVEARTQEERIDEPLPPDRGHGAEQGPVSEEPTQLEAEARAELARWLAGAEYPATREDLLALANHRAADEGVVAALGRLPRGRSYPTLQAVWEGVVHHAVDGGGAGR